MGQAQHALQPPLSTDVDSAGNGGEPPYTGATPLVDYANQYYANLAGKLNLQRLFKTSLSWFLGYCHDLADVTIVEDVTEEVIDGFVVTLIKGYQLKQTTVSQYCNMLRALFAQAIDEKLIQHNPVGDIVAFLRKEGASSLQPRASKKTDKALYSQLQPDTWQELRTLTILGLMLDTGLPASQILKTQLAAEDAADQTLPVVAPDGFYDFLRQGKIDMCPLSDLTLEYYHQWLAARGKIPKHTRSNALFIGRTGQPIPGQLFSQQLGLLREKADPGTQSSSARKQIQRVHVRVRPWNPGNEKDAH